MSLMVGWSGLDVFVVVGSVEVLVGLVVGVEVFAGAADGTDGTDATDETNGTDAAEGSDLVDEGVAVGVAAEECREVEGWCASAASHGRGAGWWL